MFQTPHNPREADAQSTLIKTRIANHQNSSPTSMLAALDQLTKGTIAIMHRVAILESENASLRKANEALSKRRRAKKKKKHACSLEGHLPVRSQYEKYLERTPDRESITYLNFLLNIDFCRGPQNWRRVSRAKPRVLNCFPR
jgi:hypothetical protein